MIEPERVPTLLAALLMVGLCLWLLWLGPARRLHRALALLIFLRALPLLALSFDDRLDSVEVLFGVYFLIALPFAAMNFGYAFRMEHGPASKWVRPPLAGGIRWGILGVALVVEALYLVRHDLWGSFGADGRFRPGWMFLFTQLAYLTFAAVALHMAMALRHMPRGEERRAVSLVALAFAIEPVYRAIFSVTSVTEVPDWTGTAGVGYGLWCAAAAVGLTAIGITWGQTRRPSGDRYATLTLVLGGATVLSALVVRAVFWQIVPTSVENGLLVLWTLDALWFTAFAAVAVYATVMHHLFDIDLKAKALINGGTLAAGLGFVLVVIGESLERVIPISEGFVAILLAVMITLLLKPAHRLAQRIAEAAFPGVERSEDYIHRRRAQLYRAALEGAYRDGDVTAKERAVLETLRDEVGLDQKAADRLERTVRAQWTAPGAAPGAAPGPQDGGLPKPP